MAWPVLTTASQRARAVEEISTFLDLTKPEAHDALGLAYDVVSENFAPYIIRCAGKMLPDLRSDVRAGRTPVYLGRDGEYLRIATRALDPELVDRHCRAVLVSRNMAVAAGLDLLGESTPNLGSSAIRIDPDNVPGAAPRLIRYLQSCGVPVEIPGIRLPRRMQTLPRAVAVYDNGFRGTIQEIIAAMDPNTSFVGRYMLFARSSADRHAEAKKGYELRLGLDRSNGGNPTSYLPSERRLTFQCNQALHLLENTMQGPLSSADLIDDNGRPVQFLAREASMLTWINPILVPEILTDPVVREGVLRINLKAVEDCAARIADLRSQGGKWKRELDLGTNRLLSNTRAWVQGGEPAPRFELLANCFGWKSDALEVRDVASILEQAVVGEKDARAIWTSFDNLGSVDAKKAFASSLKESLQGVNRPTVELWAPAGERSDVHSDQASLPPAGTEPTAKRSDTGDEPAAERADARSSGADMSGPGGENPVRTAAVACSDSGKALSARAEGSSSEVPKIHEPPRSRSTYDGPQRTPPLGTQGKGGGPLASR